MKVKALLFDLDGTLIDSKRDIVSQVNRTLREFGFIAHSEAELERGIGSGSHSLFRKLIGGGAEDEIVDRMVLKFRENYREHMADTTDVYPGVWEVLRHFKPIPKAIVTNKSQASADAICGHLGLTEHFLAIHGLEAFATQKPDPGPIREACARLGILPSEAAFVGDTTVDMAASRGAGTLSVAALYGYGTRGDLIATQPAHAIERAFELIEIL